MWNCQQGVRGNSEPYCHLTNCMTICCNCIALSAYLPEIEGICMTFFRPGGRPPVGTRRKKIGTGLVPPGSPGGFFRARSGVPLCTPWDGLLGLETTDWSGGRSGAQPARWLRHLFCAGLRGRATMPQGKDNRSHHALMVKGCWLKKDKDSKRNHMSAREEALFGRLV